VGGWTVSIKRINEYYANQNGNVVMGCDGFVDDVWQVVEKRTSPTEYKLYEKVGDYARAILARGSGGMSFELVRKRRSYGGFTCNTGKALGRLGGNLTLVGMFGIEEYDPVFNEFRESYTTISIGNPSVTLIHEFFDGKIMQGGTAPAPPTRYSWELLEKSMDLQNLRTAYKEADAVGHGYYGNRVIFEDTVSNLVNTYLDNDRCNRMFFDFGNIQNRPKDELFKTFSVLTPLNDKVPMTLSLNEHEGKILFAHYGRDFACDTPLPDTRNDIEYIREQVGLDELIIHTPFFALGASASEGSALVKQRNAPETIITTGAGDNFNGGYLSSCVQKGVLSFEERLFVANAVTGSYVRSGVSPDITALGEEMSELVKIMD
jgi:hypothetical protein